MDKKAIVCTIAVNVNVGQLNDILDTLNKHEIDEGEEKLTLTEVVNNEKLLNYICREAVEDGTAMYDPFEFWNADGWCDFKDYR